MATPVSNRYPFYQDGRFHVTPAISLYVHQWIVPSVPPKGLVIFVHGMVEHSGRYEEWGYFLANRGYPVLAIDHRGHGRSDGPRLWIDHYSDLVDDFCSFARWGASQYPELPVFIAGMSMGGGVVVRSAVRLQSELPHYSGAVLIAAGLAVNPKLYSKLRIVAPLFDIFLPRLRFIKPGIGGLAVSKTVRDQFLKDPYVCHCRMPVHFGVENVRALPVNMSCAAKITSPILICQGEADSIVSPPAAARFYEETASADKTLKFYPKLGHDIIHEENGGQVWRDILAWLENRTPSSVQETDK